MSDKFLFNGKLAEKTSDGNTVTVLNQNNVVAGTNVKLAKDGENVTVNADFGLTLNSEGLICCTYVEEEE